jgi:hypothetical protein
LEHAVVRWLGSNLWLFNNSARKLHLPSPSEWFVAYWPTSLKFSSNWHPFWNPIANTAKKTTVSSSQDKDFLCWRLALADKCNSKSAYKACLKNLQDQGEPQPRYVNQIAIQLLKRIWKNKKVTPKVKTFGCRMIRKTMLTCARAGMYIYNFKLCCRCGLEEYDVHFFFRL